MRRIGKVVLFVLGGLLLLLLILAAVSAVVNLSRPRQSVQPERLNEIEQARISEVLQLRSQLGDRVWEDWDSAEIPLIIYNESYAFLLNFPGEPANGWVEVPSFTQRGTAWQLVLNDTFASRPYYRQPIVDDQHPQAFAMLVGDTWVAGMSTLEWTRIGLSNEIAVQMPGVLRSVFPYTLFVNQLVNGSDHYVVLVEHESLHAFQGQRNPERLIAAETLREQVENSYPWGNYSGIDTDAFAQICNF